jgi:two-component system alkaline phosphatase synthesis response regulator PhoP
VRSILLPEPNFTRLSPSCHRDDTGRVEHGYSMPATILTVDDERDVTDLVHFHLSRAGYHVLTAASGREALESIQAHPPDLILLDLMLPDIDGFGLCEILRRQGATATIPVVILTAWATADARHFGLELGALDYLTKPFSPKDLVQRVRRLLDLRLRPAIMGA